MRDSTRLVDNEPAVTRLTLRSATDADVLGLLHLSLDAIRLTAAQYYTPWQLDARAAIRTLQGHWRIIGTTRVVVAELDREVAGFVNLDVASATVDQLFVAPASGGRGIGSALLTGVEALAAEEGLTHLTAHASKRAVTVFERSGYRRTQTEHVKLGEQVLDRFQVRKELRRTATALTATAGSDVAAAGSLQTGD